MQLRQDSEIEIRMALQRECRSISASDELKHRIDQAIYEKQEENSMKHLSVKKLCAGVAAACMILSCGSVFAARVVGFAGGSSSVPEYTSYAQIGEAEDKMGFQSDHIEKFVNGYIFSGTCIGKMDAYGETNGTLYTVQTLELTYSKSGQPDINLAIEKKIKDIPTTKQPDSVRSYGEVLLRYDEYTYKFVPTSYELTEEDKANMLRDDYNISVGTDEVEIQKVTEVKWEKDGISYELFGFDLNLSAEEMLDMAEEILSAN